MAKPRELRRRIRSVENTGQITYTMEMVATSKLKRATERVHAVRPYAAGFRDVIHALYDPALVELEPLLRIPEPTRAAAVLLLTANRGLCGGFNTNLIREARRLLDRLRAHGVESKLHVVGRKGVTYFRFRREPLASQRMDIPDRPTLEHAESVVAPLRQAFGGRAVDAVYLVSSEFRSPLSTPPGVLELLPIRAPDRAARLVNPIVSPPPQKLLAQLLPLYLRNAVYRALVENAAAEQGARRTAMKNATDNAGEMLDVLRRTYNRARQAQITQEIAEIVGGAEALG
ncbi:MAG: ATP synthase F1 subunit gamma [Gemmatimonadetes bacterium]|nr:ATP synthase F1 subunit gamma [Gemmatimonadota bacterium]